MAVIYSSINPVTCKHLHFYNTTPLRVIIIIEIFSYPLFCTTLQHTYNAKYRFEAPNEVIVDQPAVAKIDKTKFSTPENFMKLKKNDLNLNCRTTGVTKNRYNKVRPPHIF